MNKRELLMHAKRITTDNLPDLLSLIPVVGVPMSIGTKLVIGGLETRAASEDELVLEQLKEQVKEIDDAITKFGEEAVIGEIQKAVLDQIDQVDKHDLVYISGVTLYLSQEEPMTEADNTFFDELLTGQVEYPTIDEDSIIEEYMEAHCNDKDYIIFKDRIYINFDVDDDMFDIDTTLSLRNETVRFIDMINRIRVGKTMIRKYQFY